MNSLWMKWFANDHTQSCLVDSNLPNSGVQGFKYFSIKEEEKEDNTGKVEAIGDVKMKVLKMKLGRQLEQIIDSEVLEE